MLYRSDPFDVVLEVLSCVEELKAKLSASCYRRSVHPERPYETYETSHALNGDEIH